MMVKLKGHRNFFFPDLDLGYIPIAWEPERTGSWSIVYPSILRERPEDEEKRNIWSNRTRSLPHHQILYSRYVRVRRDWYLGSSGGVHVNEQWKRPFYATLVHLPRALSCPCYGLPTPIPGVLPVPHSIFYSFSSSEAWCAAAYSILCVWLLI